MKKNIYPAIIIALMALVSSCSNMRYAYLDKVDAHMASHQISREEKISILPDKTNSSQPTEKAVRTVKNNTHVVFTHQVKITPRTNKIASVIDHSFTKVVEKKNAIKEKISPADHGLWLGAFLWTLIAILIVLWLLAILTGGWGLGGLVHIILVVALVILLLRLLGILI